MVHVDVKDIYEKRYALLWCLLSFKSGLLNAAGFLLAGSYVSHVTGFGTQVGIAIGHDEVDFGLNLFIIPVSFIAGSTLVSIILDTNFSKTRVPNYPIVQIIITAVLGLISLLFSVGVFSSSSLPAQDPSSLLLIGLLCFVCGLKNGLTTWASHGKIRTTHLTGLATDIGLHLPKMFRPDGSPSRYPEPKTVNRVRILTLASFSAGSCLSALLIPWIGYKLFYIALIISIILSVVSIFHRKAAAENQLKIESVQNLPAKSADGGIYANLN